MNKEDDTTLNVEGLDHLLKALKAKPPIVRVGILGDKNARSGKSHSNATVGAAHEFGTTKIPQRSFLRIPLTEKLQSYMESSGALDKATMAEVIRQGSVVPWLRKIAILSEKIVADAFATGGFGKWQSWKNPNYQNNTGQLLIDSQQLRNSITSEVKA